MRRLYSLWVMVLAVLVVNRGNMPYTMGTIKNLKSYVHTVQSRFVILNLVTTCHLVTIFQRPFFNLLHKIIQDQKCH